MKNLELPNTLPEDFQYTEVTGLTPAQAEERRLAGLSNKMAFSDEKPVSKILAEHFFTLFNFLNFGLAICLLLVGSYKNMLFICLFLCEIPVGIAQ